mgnify:CR=1 FL=1
MPGAGVRIVSILNGRPDPAAVASAGYTIAMLITAGMVERMYAAACAAYEANDTQSAVSLASDGGRLRALALQYPALVGVGDADWPSFHRYEALVCATDRLARDVIAAGRVARIADGGAK